MSAEPLHRILMAVDASARGRTALELALELAAESKPEWQGLFVEDLNLLRLAGLPFAREIAATALTGRPLDLARLERSLRRQAEQVQASFAELAQQAGTAWSFQVVRGHLARELRTRLQGFDLCIVGRENPLAALRGAPPSGQTVAAVPAGSLEASHALQVAARLAGAGGRRLLVLEAGEEQRTARAGKRQFAGLPAGVERRALPASEDIRVLARALAREAPIALVLDLTHPLANSIDVLLGELSSALVLVR